MIKLLQISVVSVVLIFNQNSHGTETEIIVLEDVLAGFDNNERLSPAHSISDSPPQKGYHLSGSLNFDIACSLKHHTANGGSYDYRGLNVFRPGLNLEFDRKSDSYQLFLSGHFYYDFNYAIRGRENYPPQLLSTYQEEIELSEFWISSKIGKSNIRLGRQIVSWGASDIFRPIDIVNTIDIRTPSLTNLNGLKLPALISRLEIPLKQLELGIILIHENRVKKMPVYGNDFYPFDFPLPPVVHDDFVLEDTGAGVELGIGLESWYLSLSALTLVQEQNFVGLTKDDSERLWNRIFMLGVSGTKPVGQWLFKTDLALFDGIQYYQLDQEEKSKIEFNAGIDYSGWEHSFFSLEIFYRHVFGLDSSYKNDINYPLSDVLALGIAYSRSFSREKLNLKALIRIYGFNHGGTQRMSFTYRVTDANQIEIGLMFFQGGDNYIFENIGENTRAFVQYKYFF